MSQQAPPCAHTPWAPGLTVSPPRHPCHQAQCHPAPLHRRPPHQSTSSSSSRSTAYPMYSCRGVSRGSSSSASSSW